MSFAPFNIGALFGQTSGSPSPWATPGIIPQAQRPSAPSMGGLAEILKLQQEAQGQYEQAARLRSIGGANSRGWGDVIATLIGGYRASKMRGEADENIARAIEKQLAYEQEQKRLQAEAEARQRQAEDERAIAMHRRKAEVDAEFRQPRELSDFERFQQDPEGYAKFKRAGQAPAKPSEFEIFRQNPDEFREFKAAGRSPGVVVNTGETYSPFQKELAKADADTYSEYRSQAVDAQSNLATLSRLEDIMQKFETGKLDEALARMGQYFGTEAGANMQAFNAIVGDLVMKELNAMKGPATEKEREYLQQLMVKAGNDPRANAEILEFLRQKNQGRVQLYQSADEYARQNGSLTGFTPPTLQSNFGPSTTMSEGQDLGGGFVLKGVR